MVPLLLLLPAAVAQPLRFTTVIAAAKAAGQIPTPPEINREAGRILAAREIKATLAGLNDLGSEARYLAVDITDRAALAGALDKVRADWGPVAAVVHGAGVLADKAKRKKYDEGTASVADLMIGFWEKLTQKRSRRKRSTIAAGA